MKNKIIASFILPLTLLAACSKGGGSGKKSTEPPVKDQFETEMYGTYQALLSPVNKEVSGHLNGSLTLVRERTEFVADVRFSGGPATSIHIQNIHVGDRCPDERDDLNADGYIDAEEGAQVYKEILIPLDDDLGSQRMGGGTYPVTDEYGYYFWSRVTEYEKMMEDLREEDIHLTDDYVKLPHHKSLSMTGKVVVIYGVPDTAVLPETVLSRGRLTKHQSLPVACGIIRKLEHVPGVVDNDLTGIPVPEGETVGGSSGADDGAIFEPQAETDDGNYGEEDAPEVRGNSTEFPAPGGGTL